MKTLLSSSIDLFIYKKSMQPPRVLAPYPLIALGEENSSTPPTLSKINHLDEKGVDETSTWVDEKR